jgi:hypothetical protein
VPDVFSGTFVFFEVSTIASAIWLKLLLAKTVFQKSCAATVKPIRTKLTITAAERVTVF